MPGNCWAIIPMPSLPYREIWAVDFEFHDNGKPGNQQYPVCMVAKEIISGKVVRMWRDELLQLSEPPFDISANSLIIAYFLSAEIHCFCVLGWPLPENLIDCFVGFRVLTNGRPVIAGNGLLGALRWFGLASIATEEKTEMRALILSCGPWSDNEKLSILDYCQTDVDAVAELFPVLVKKLSSRQYWLSHALNRGNYMAASGVMEFNGIPIDVKTLQKMDSKWDEIRAGLISDIVKEFDVFEGITFRLKKFEALLTRLGYAWPTTKTGVLALDRETFRQQVRIHPDLAPIREVRDNLSSLRLSNLQVGADGRNRTLLSPFAAKTGRNLPSNAKFIFGPSAWMRGLIKPAEGMGIAYVDFSSQEIAIAAALSGDEGMKRGYMDGDPYLDFAVRAGLAPETATKASHKAIRQMCKQVVLGVQYGMQAESLAMSIGAPLYKGQQLLRAHKEAYPTYWRWVETTSHYCRSVGYIETVFGWRKFINEADGDTTLQNFPCQANGAEMLRLACSMAVRAGLKIVAPIHDAILLESSVDRLDGDVAELRAIMAKAGRIVLNGFVVWTDVEIVVYPDRYSDERGVKMWEKIQSYL